VTLTGKVASGAMTNVALSSDNPAATVPALVPVPAGADSATVTVQTNKVTSQTKVTLTASYGGVSKTVTLTISAPPMPDLYIYNVIYYDTSGSGINSPQAGQAFQICVNVVNGGGAKADSSTLRVTLFQSGNPAQEIKRWDKDVPALNPGTGTGAANPCIDVPALSAGYTYDFNIYVDVDNGVAESNENNNYGHVAFGF
jgi:subtilase family serine protease